jgi:hypothetical protein
MKQVIMNIEPSTKLSELCGFPYFIEKKYSLDELVNQGIINETDIKEMEAGKQICKRIPIVSDK